MKRKIIKNKNALSEVISTIMVVSIVVSTVAVILGWGVPYLEEQKIKSNKQTAESNLISLSDSVNDLIMKGVETGGVSDVSNQNDKGSITLDSDSDKFVLWYTFNDDYDFDVSGLDDENKQFEITEIKEPAVDGGIDRVDVYKIDPGLSQGRLADSVWYKKIYNGTNLDGQNANHVCSQRFVVPNGVNNRVDKLLLYIGKSGDISSDLTAGIYLDDGGGKPNMTRSFKCSLSSYNIYGSLSWVEFNFSQIPHPELISGNKYHIVLNTTSGDELENFYYWYLNDNVYGVGADTQEPSNDEYALEGKKDEVSNFVWTDLTYNDFSRRIYYTEEPIPSVLEITNTDGATNFFSGVEYTFRFTFSYEYPYDALSYLIYWGGGYYTDGTATSGEVVFKSHIWPEAGSYKIRVTVKDVIGTVNDEEKNYPPGYYDYLAIEPFETLPSDIDIKDLNLGVDDGYINSNYNLENNLFINLFDFDNDVYAWQDVSLAGKVPFGRIWVFDIGALTVTAPFGSDTVKTIYQNGAIISVSKDGTQFIQEPSIFEKKIVDLISKPDDKYALALRLNQINGDVSVGGNFVTAQLSYSLVSSYSREPYIVDDFYNLKIQIFGENKEIWYNYLIENYGFSYKDDDPNTDILIYDKEKATDNKFVPTDYFSLILDSSYIDFELVRTK